MTRSDLRALARLTVSGAKKGVVSNTNLNLLIELGILDLANFSVCLKKNATFTVTAETADYVISTELTDYLTMDKPGLWWYDGSNWKQLDAVTFAYLDENFPLWRDDSSDNPLRYSLNGDIITVHPKPDTTLAAGFKLYYGHKPTRMTNDNHYPFVGSTTERPHLSIFDDAILKYLKWKLEPMINKDATVNFNEQAYIKERREKKALFNRRSDIKAKLQGPKFRK